MATAEEQKSKLQTSRQRLRQKGLSPTRFEMRRKHFGIEDVEKPNELIHSGETRQAGSKNLFDVAELDTKRRAALFASRLQTGIGQGWQSEATRQAGKEGSSKKDARQAGLKGLTDNDFVLPDKGARGRMTLMIEQAIARRQNEAGKNVSDYAPTSKETQKLRKEIKKKAEAATRRGLIAGVDSIAAALDMSSVGISFLIDVGLYFFTLSWLNLEMIYGKHFAKGKSRFISPISWEPIPMPVDKDAIILQGFIVAVDLALGLALVVFTFSGFCLLHDYVKITSTIAGAFQTGASFASGNVAGLCTGGILSSVLGL
jgi:hypothetical protein